MSENLTDFLPTQSLAKNVGNKQKMSYEKHKIELKENGFSVLDDLYSDNEISEILNCLENAEQNESSFMKTKDLFAIRQLIKNVPELTELLFNEKLTELISDLSESEYFLTKAIYFDKPSESNWFVAYHQDLSISVEQKTELQNGTEINGVKITLAE